MIVNRQILSTLGVLSIFLCLSCSNDSKIEAEVPENELPSQNSNEFYKGTTMGFISHIEAYGNVIYKENGVPKDPFQSIFDHGGNMVRFRIDLPPFANQYSQGYPDPDFRSPENVKLGIQRAKIAGLNTLLTFSYHSMALETNQKLNNYVAPLNWQSIVTDIEKLKDSVYMHTYSILEDYVSSGLVPKIVSIGNETNWRILEANISENDLAVYNAARTVSLLNSGTKAVNDINAKYDTSIKRVCHIFGASNLKWWLSEHMPHGLDFDVMALSHYHGWHSLGDFNNWTEVIDWLKDEYNKDFLMLETAQLFTTGGNDTHVDILGANNIPVGYENPPTTNTQKEYLKDFGQELINAGGLGLIVWGGEWVGSDCLIYPDQWGVGSSWENKAFWDFNYNLHDGVNWMNEISIMDY
ncbi:arabinogalactan endo-1,4-beta-galactosidase [Seonamhaeicola sp. MEBiC1930]|uniref:glycosyl hydrolase 53 family protein n=1 Tax=Seonamhaeicola sp. MEBiC01930 TaxID=2976768 RepID=UPI00324450D7